MRPAPSPAPVAATTAAGAAPLAALLRPGTAGDLPAVNAVVEAAVTAWPLPERLRRRALPLLRYTLIDMHDHQVLLAEAHGHTEAFAAWSDGAEDPQGGCRALLLHGLYVRPSSQGRGYGRLLQNAVWASRSPGASGLLVRAERVSESYFAGCGYRRLPESPDAHPRRYWLASNRVHCLRATAATAACRA